MRDLSVVRKFQGIRAGLAQEFCQYSGSLASFKAFFDPVQLGRYEARTYSALDVRRARLRMAGASADARRTGDLPPLINARMAKGGTGKSSVTANVASALSLMGYKVLMIDADPQSSLTSLFGINWATEEITHIGELMHRVYRGKPAQVEDAVWSVYSGGMLDLIPADITLANTDASWLMAAANREHSFKRLLDSNVGFFSQYDVIMVDSAPGATLLTTSIMYASKTLLAVVMLNGHSLRAMEVLISDVNELNHHFSDRNLNLGVHIVANGYHAGYASCTDSLRVLQQQFGPYLDNNVIPYAASFMRDMNVFDETLSGTVLEREPKSVGARAIIDLTRSLIARYEIKFPAAGAQREGAPKMARAPKGHNKPARVQVGKKGA